MPMPNWIGRLLPFLTFLTIRKRCQRRVSLIKIEAAKAYVLGVKTMRFILLGALVILFSLLLLAGGLFLIHAALFVYSGWSVKVKFFVALLLGGLEIFTAGGVLYYLFREETWVRYSGIKHVLESVIKRKDA